MLYVDITNLTWLDISLVVVWFMMLLFTVRNLYQMGKLLVTMLKDENRKDQAKNLAIYPKPKIND
jgi:hypothetical protein